jgi:hypothetical protein
MESKKSIIFKLKNAFNQGNKYYSQHGEDYLINQIFGKRTEGFYVEVGCIDGKRFSNSYFLKNKAGRVYVLKLIQDILN